MKRHAAALLAMSLAVVGCSSSSTAPPPAPDAGNDAGITTLNGCGATELAASDHTAPADPRAIVFPGEGQAAAQFSPHCMTVKVGQTVTWTGGLGTHPLEAQGGDAHNPITLTTSGASVQFAFAAAGTFGFECSNHPTIMRGAIRVVP